MVWPFDKAKKAVNSVDPRRIVHEELEKFARNFKTQVIKEIKDQLKNEVIKPIKNEVVVVQGKVVGVEQSIKQVKNNVGNNLKKIEDKLKPLEDKIVDFTGNFDDLIITALNKALEKLNSLITNEGERIVGIAIPDRFGCKLTVIEMGYTSIDRARIKAFFYRLKTAKLDKSTVLDLIEKIAPDWVKINIEGELPIVPAGFGLYPEWDTVNFLKYGRELLGIRQ